MNQKSKKWIAILLIFAASAALPGIRAFLVLAGLIGGLYFAFWKKTPQLRNQALGVATIGILAGLVAPSEQTSQTNQVQQELTATQTQLNKTKQELQKAKAEADKAKEDLKKETDKNQKKEQEQAEKKEQEKAEQEKIQKEQAEKQKAEEEQRAQEAEQARNQADQAVQALEQNQILENIGQAQAAVDAVSDPQQKADFQHRIELVRGAIQARQEEANRLAQEQQQAQQQAQAPQTAQYFPNCSAARAAGAAPVYRGNPGYGSHLDRDGDGIGCER
ncbi:excalibur calcium-binding domain-containing protein [Streptococcus danieliae]|uniref:Excalibur calcium-binding domain-containing protein n=1 Tax=Streptococcus danieliae TaxID=747656 RepID=A0A7Z0LDT0_9STRE|nr:excalibur calcium-binding domain-containing protein [Streptococcus danieliae]MBF0717558.1 excalibur calcium-binding domain-containing protein [Streptococcus danieliae]NYS49488.1 excalibur calcium-binding domain-containing protein [Streptococcus danieliae]